MLCIAVSASFRLYDTDLWQLLVTGKAIWLRHEIPGRDLWAWPTWGAPQITSSWAFRALLWPISTGRLVPKMFEAALLMLIYLVFIVVTALQAGR